VYVHISAIALPAQGVIPPKLTLIARLSNQPIQSDLHIYVRISLYAYGNLLSSLAVSLLPAFHQKIISEVVVI